MVCFVIKPVRVCCSGGAWRSGRPARARSRQRVQTVVITLGWILEAECDDCVTNRRNSTQPAMCVFVSEKNRNKSAAPPTNSVTFRAGAQGPVSRNVR